MHEHDTRVNQNYPTIFISTLPGRQELTLLTRLLAQQDDLYQTAGEEMLAHLGLRRTSANLTVGPSRREAGLE